MNNKKYGRLKFPLLWLRGPGIVHADSLSQTKQSHQIFLYQCFTIMSSNIFSFLLKKKKKKAICERSFIWQPECKGIYFLAHT